MLSKISGDDSKNNFANKIQNTKQNLRKAIFSMNEKDISPNNIIKKHTCYFSNEEIKKILLMNCYKIFLEYKSNIAVVNKSNKYNKFTLGNIKYSNNNRTQIQNLSFVDDIVLEQILNDIMDVNHHEIICILKKIFNIEYNDEYIFALILYKGVLKVIIKKIDNYNISFLMWTTEQLPGIIWKWN
jgi:hypothetical protein